MVLFDEFNALGGRIDQRVADCLEHLRSLEQPVEVAVVDSGLRIEEDTKFSGFVV